MPRLDHAAFETPDPDRAADFYERGNTGFAFHKSGGPGDHVGVRVSEEEREQLKRRLDEAGIEWHESDHGIAKGVFFRDPDGRQLEAITYASGDDPRRP
jgi:catechol 2,3-dioxygenase-like lactoylglutathione lyase family enzyme